jgi:transposase InsO family protein
LHVEAATLRRWETHWRRDRLRSRARGRPAKRPERWQREVILVVIGLLGPQIGVPTLERLFPGVSRGELRELLVRYRWICRRLHRKTLHVLHWTRTGAVWAMDFGDPPMPIDAVYRKILAIRDLASGYQLMGLACPQESAKLVIGILDALARWQGVPLVLKIDNGPSFLAEELKTWAKEHEVVLLYSPPGTPAYNGAIEAGMGSIKVRAGWHAAMHGRPAEWTCDDVEAAVAEANETARPHGRQGPTPAQAWTTRIPITTAERAAFRSRVRRFEREERHARGTSPWVRLQHYEQASIDRMAVRRALVAEGFLLIRRRRVSPPVFHSRAKNIS